MPPARALSRDVGGEVQAWRCWELFWTCTQNLQAAAGQCRCGAKGGQKSPSFPSSSLTPSTAACTCLKYHPSQEKHGLLRETAEISLAGPG